MVSEPRFDIFSGSIDKDAMWIESIAGLAQARQRMEAIAIRVPGKYFIFSIYSHLVLARIDTTRNFLTAKNCTRAKDVA
jgi:hypothetical protein